MTIKFDDFKHFSSWEFHNVKDIHVSSDGMMTLTYMDGSVRESEIPEGTIRIETIEEEWYGTNKHV